MDAVRIKIYDYFEITLVYLYIQNDCLKLEHIIDQGIPCTFDLKKKLAWIKKESVKEVSIWVFASFMNFKMHIWS